MGIGDEIMTSGRARQLYETTGRKVVVVDEDGVPRRHRMWHGLDFIANCSDENTVFLQANSAVRPYILSRENGRDVYNLDHRPVPGSIVFTGHEMAAARGFKKKHGAYVILEPNVKGVHSADNKDWGWEKWKGLAVALTDSGIRLVQFVYGDRPLLPHVKIGHANDFRSVAAHLPLSDCVVTSEGGLHHAAAALGTDAVVIWGGRTSPKFLGYPTQSNVFHDDSQSPCGSIESCPHCRDCMDRTTVDEVYNAVMERLTWKN